MLIAGLSIMGSFASLLIPWLAAQFLGEIFNADQAGSNTIIIAIILSLFSITALNILTTIASETASGKVLEKLRTEIHNHLQYLPLEFHSSSRQGDLLGLTTYQVQNLSCFLTSTLAGLPALIVTAAGAILALFLIDPVMAWIIPVMMPIFFILMKVFGRRIRAASTRVLKAENNLIDFTDTNLGIIPAVKVTASEKMHQRQFAKAAHKARLATLGEARLQSLMGPIFTLTAALSGIALLVIAGERAGAEKSSPKELFALIFYAALLTRPIGQLANFYGSFRQASATLSRFKAVLSRPEEAGYSKQHVISGAKGNISFEEVTFGYPGRPLLFEKFDLSIKAGSVVAITGDNGVGKSTLAHLLLALYDLSSGRITLDGQNIAETQVQSLRRQFGYVPQRALLFNGTIAENITLGIDQYSETQSKLSLERAIRISQSEEFISELPDGLNTQIGDNGVRLSGGQRQKIALARALLNEPPIFIFDEATSMYDNDSEAAFLEACVEHLRGHTIILITHRQASIDLADHIVRLDQGSSTQTHTIA